MGSNYYGEGHYSGNERGGGGSLSSPPSSSSSRKGKKGNSDKPKQPQRGLGVAQLEKIRLNSQLGCSYLPSVHNPYGSNYTQEDYRLQTAHSSSYSTSSTPSYGYQGHHAGVMMGLSDLDKANMRYGDSSQPSGVASRWHPGNAASAYGTPHYNVDPRVTLSFLEPDNEGSYSKKNMKERQDRLMGTGSHNSESSNSDEIDLELRLSL